MMRVHLVMHGQHVGYLLVPAMHWRGFLERLAAESE